MTNIYHVRYTCSGGCGVTFLRRQLTEKPDEDITLCRDCIDIIFTDLSHGNSKDDPWTGKLIRQIRGTIEDG